MTGDSSYIRTYLLVLALMMLPVICGCSDASDSSGAATGSVGRVTWSKIELVERYSFQGQVLGDKDLSGIAFASKSQGLIGSDEGREVQAIELSRPDKTLKIGRTIRLLDTGSEIDIEAIAADERFYYVIGSHGVAKTTGEVQMNRFKIFRLPVHTEAGSDAVETADLVSVLSADPVLGPHFRKPLQHHGVNIEGLAVRNDRLFVGLRSPNLNGTAFVLEIGAQDVFAHRPMPPYTLHKLNLGAGLGVRDIAPVQSGFLILAGNAGADPTDQFPVSEDYLHGRGFELYYWDGKGTAVARISSLPHAPAKAEAMAVLEETQESVTVLILFDGVAGGAPSVYRIH